jgi:hypothetical protein
MICWRYLSFGALARQVLERIWGLRMAAHILMAAISHIERTEPHPYGPAARAAIFVLTEALTKVGYCPRLDATFFDCE